MSSSDASRRATGWPGRDGLAEERIALMKQTGSILREHNALLEAYRPDPAKVGVLFDPNGYNLEWAQDSVAARARDSVTAYLTALEHLQVPYTLVESSHLAALKDLKVLIAPFPIAVPDAAAGPIADFVRGGGTVLVESEAGAYTEEGIYRYPAAERPLAAALGIEDLGRRPLKTGEFRFAYGKESYDLRAAIWITPLLANGATVLARDGAGNVLATARQSGKGTMIALGTFIGKGYAEARYGDFERFLEPPHRLRRRAARFESARREAAPVAERTGCRQTVALHHQSERCANGARLRARGAVRLRQAGTRAAPRRQDQAQARGRRVPPQAAAGRR